MKGTLPLNHKRKFLNLSFINPFMEIQESLQIWKSKAYMAVQKHYIYVTVLIVIRIYIYARKLKLNEKCYELINDIIN